MKNTHLTRRDFVKLTATATAATSALGMQLWAVGTNNRIPYRTLGEPGEKVSSIGLGGAHIGFKEDEEESIRIIRTAIDEGINFLDNCWDYNGGASEERMGKALRDGLEKSLLDD